MTCFLTCYFMYLSYNAFPWTYCATQLHFDFWKGLENILYTLLLGSIFIITQRYYT